MQFRRTFTFASAKGPAINSAGQYDALVPISMGGVGSYLFSPTDPPAGAALLIDNPMGCHVYAAWGSSSLPRPPPSDFASKSNFTISPGATVTVLLPTGGQDTLYLQPSFGGGQIPIMAGTMSLTYDAGFVEMQPGSPGALA